MRKTRYIFLLASAVGGLFFAGCLKNSSQTTGPQGATGPTGAAGGDFLPITTVIQLSPLTLQPVNANISICKWSFSGYNPNPKNITYMLSVYATKESAQTPGIWNKLPYPNVYQTGDYLSASIAGDTVTLIYNGPSGWPNTGDSTIDCRIIVLPLSQ